MKNKLLITLLFINNFCFSQSLNQDKTSLTNFIKSNYTTTRSKHLETYIEIAIEYARNQPEIMYNNINWK